MKAIRRNRKTGRQEDFWSGDDVARLALGADCANSLSCRLPGALGRSLALIGVCAACDSGGWRVLETGSDARIQSVYVVSPESILAAGDRGVLLEYDGVAFTETATDADPGPRLFGFYGVASSGGVVRVAGDGGTVLVRVEDELVREDSNTQQRLLTLNAASPSIWFAGGENGRAIRRANGAWSRIDINAGDSKITGSWSSGPGAVAFTTDTGMVIENDGGDWTAARLETETGSAALPLFGVWSSTAGADMIAVGLGGAVFRRARGNSTFELEDSPARDDLYAVYGISEDRIWAVGANGAILEWNGLEWRAVPSGTAQDLYSIHAAEDGSYVVAAGDRGAMVVLTPEP
jgi:hypothetical protein